ncbi:MAG: beta-ketoacyl synthase, partial [Elusimicrobia bacterium CG08_land_8_20_14_0_20_51_18]
MEKEKIAIIGIGIIAPKALNKDEFWSNVINKRNCIVEVPKDRWDTALYYDPDPKAKDKTYSKIGGFIENFKFDSIKYKIPPTSAAQIARLQQMTIEAARMALEDAKYDHAKNDPRRTGVVIANAMGAQRKEMTDMRVYKFLNEDIMLKTSVASALSQADRTKMIAEYEKGLDGHVINITEDTMPGELANVTSGRVANIFNFNGPNLTLDAACASSFAALDYAVMALRSGKMDVAVTGGADEMMSPAAYVKFCKIGALSPDGSWAFDARANGFVMGEAVGIYVLKRFSDAVRDGDRIYALINSVGASSDGKGKGITAPNPKGQKMAIENAFAEVDYSPADIDFVECHGTATKAGDLGEMQVMKEFFANTGKKIKVTSVKSQIGHSKAAAGAVSLIKTALALHNKVLPPSINYKTPNSELDASVIEVITEPGKWETKGLRRANVSSFGFGGANFHVAMEEYAGQKPKAGVRGQGIEESAMKTVTAVPSPASSLSPLTSPENPKTPYAGLQGETFTVTAENMEELAKELDALYAKAKSLGERYPLARLSVPMNEMPQKNVGVAIVAKSPKDLTEKIDLVRKSYNEKIFKENPLSFKLKGVYAFTNKINYGGKIGFLFPGQGSQYVDMMRDLAAKYEVVKDTFDEADKILQKMIGVNLTDTLWSKPGESKEELEKREAAIKQTQMTQPAMMTADMAMFRLLTSYGIKPDMAIGHSLGEYAAATAAGIFTLENGLKAVTSRAKEMSNIKVKDPGKMASVAWGCEKVEEQLRKIDGYVIAANKNCPIQTVIAGERKAVEEAVKLFQNLGVQAQEIAVSHAFHSSIIEPAIGPYRDFLQKIPIKSWDMPILSNVTADFFPKDTQGIYDMLVKQMVSPVQFIDQINRMYAEGVRVFIECGPKRVLSAFVTTTLESKKDIFILSSNHPKRGGIFEYNDMLANMMTVGFRLNWRSKAPHIDDSFYNPYYLNWAASFYSGEKQPVLSPGREEGKNNMGTNISEFAKNYGFNFNDIVVSGIAGGTPGTWGKLFREKNLDEILDGKNMIESIPHEWRRKQIDKNIIRVIKSDTGNHRIEAIDSVDDAIKLSSRKGQFNIEKEFGIPPTMAKAMNDTFKMALGAGVLALKDAGLPLVHYYKKTTTGGWLPEKWALPEPLASETGVVFASAFPTMESVIHEVTAHFLDKYSGLGDDRLWEVYDSIVDKLHSEEDKKEIRKWMKENIKKLHSPEKKEKHVFSQNFLLKVIPIADSQFAQWVGAKGPSIHLSAACASTTQAVNIAEVWIRSGKCKRVVVIGADDISNEATQQWAMPGFLSSGTATTKELVKDAALPFDNRRHGLIVGSASVALVIEDATLSAERGMKPLARLLLSEAANSAFHVTKLDVDHVSRVMDNFLSKIEKIYGLSRKEMAPKTVFFSHETYTPKRGGSAAAEVEALKRTFREDTQKVIVSNVKGFTGHTMGAALEDAIAVRALNTGIVPPIANYREPDPELAGINLSKGGKYDFKYSIRFAAGFGSHMAMSLMEKIYSEGEKRTDEGIYNKWLETISGYEKAQVEVVLNTLRVKDQGPMDTRQKAEGIRHKAEATSPESRVSDHESPVSSPESMAPEHGYTRPVSSPQPAVSGQRSAASNEPQAETAEAQGIRQKAEEHKSQHAHEPAVSSGLKPSASSPSLNEDSVKAEILNMISEKTGYPKDMLELDLDMEADLGIDTVKQAELFAMMREHFDIPQKGNLSLKDYPTIRHCIRFVLDET